MDLTVQRLASVFVPFSPKLPRQFSRQRAVLSISALIPSVHRLIGRLALLLDTFFSKHTCSTNRDRRWPAFSYSFTSLALHASFNLCRCHLWGTTCFLFLLGFLNKLLFSSASVVIIVTGRLGLRCVARNGPSIPLERHPFLTTVDLDLIFYRTFSTATSCA